ncbi:antA/AntB antirepressor family protein [Chondrinema litorale]|uniref:antA/AntB antirepressor family protein n=1 Tax=Chondrinema litorale TaxID=2994555 RepID=UPI0025428628|nr:antA/AntB antirepressor family protein [Chondrinema litorale]UZR99816.1 antA/AntB antirepressor family protein [Chondrinema litorale]
MELIKIYKGNLVDARELHQFLESKRDFSNWITQRINRYGFIDGEDFTTNLLKSTGGRPSKEYYLTFDMAKELAMVENNDRGRQARRYFIEAEQALMQLRQNERLESFLKLEESKDNLYINIQNIGGSHADFVQVDLDGRKVFFNGEPLPDEQLHEMLLKARDFAIAMTNDNFKSDIRNLKDATFFHKRNHADVRDLLKQNTGKLPEEIDPEDDIKQIGQ